MHKYSILSFIFAAFLIFAGSASAQTSLAPQAVANGELLGPYSDAQAGTRFFRLSLPAGSKDVQISISGAAGSTGDCDLYVRYNRAPATNAWDFRPYLTRSNESVTLPAPSTGDYYIMLRAYSAYTGVNLSISFTAPPPPPAQQAAAPVISLASGSYNGQAFTTLSSSTPNSVIRYTTDGSTPNENSEVYTAAIFVNRSMNLQAYAEALGFQPSSVTGANYTIVNALRVINKDEPISGLAGAQRSQMNFRLAVPPGQTSLTISISGAADATGDSDLYVRRGSLPTTSAWDYRPYLSRSNETVQVTNPAPGDWFIMINGYRAYTQVTLSATYTGTAFSGKPDLIFHAGSLFPRITTETFAATNCAVVEQSIPEGTHRLLRFSTETRNIGTGDLFLGSPANNTSFTWGSCHGHYHFNSFAVYRLRDGTGRVVRTGSKLGFCLMDSIRPDTNANPNPRYNCSNQGIQAGWADIYSSFLTGQWIVITGLPAGQYVLEVEVDPMNYIDEENETNNVTRVNVTIPNP
jgi:hypothetical protein